ncbi:MAG: PQQ-binding-like beta-propeller repeat protein [Candidatus Bathyarchaeota archaeon]|nr:PQQ-binding-like beta-propeller repeat protein [Candidatus Bathyarchaeota archaeon]
MKKNKAQLISHFVTVQTEKTKNLKNRRLLSIITIVSLLLTMSICIPTTDSQVTMREFTLFVAVGPQTIGVGQSTQIVVWANVVPMTYISQNLSAGAGLLRFPRYHNYVVTITDPDGQNDTRTFKETDSLGTVAFNYVPTKVGTYKVSAYYPGESFENVEFFKANVAFKPAQSRVATFVAQQEPIPYWTETPLPTEYWTRPIDASNQQWASIASNWLRMGMGGSQNRYWTNFQPYGTAPNTAHILWSTVFDNGGLVGGEVGESGYYTGESYQSKFAPIILNGKLYSNTRVGPATTLGYVCYDLATGKELFRRSDYTLTCAFSFSNHWENAHGTIDFLIQRSGTNMYFFDPRNGENVFNITNVPSGGALITVVTPEGVTNDLNIYTLSGGNLTKWSFYETVKPTGTQTSWSPSRTTAYNGTAGIIYNVAIPRPQNSAGQFLSGDYAFGTNGGECDGTWIIGRSVNTTTAPPTVYLTGIRCSDGKKMWETSHQLLEDPSIWRGGGGTHLDTEGGVYLNYKKETMQALAIDINNGQVKYYTPPRNASDWGSYTSGWCMDSAYGKLFIGTYDGYMNAYDIKTGKLLWQYYSGDAGLMTPYGTYPFFLGIYMGMGIADGKVFAATGEHSANDPLYRGERLHVINATTGEGVWSIQGWWTDFAIADGQYTAYNGYDGRVYSFGKGPSAMTATVSPKVSVSGSSVLIEGTVTDISAGTSQYLQTKRFPNGVPVVSDESMSSWMEYVYMQQPKPTNAKGVKVMIDVIDSNNNYRNIGETTSDMNGCFSFEWKPDIPGKYTVIASFAGSESYWPSQAQTAFAVDEVQPTPTQQAQTASEPPMELYFAISTISIVIAIAIVGLLLLRKRP